MMLFCGMCGANLSQICSNCEQPSPLNYRFCGHCGLAFDSLGSQPGADQLASPGAAKLQGPSTESLAIPLSGERRQATVLIADVKGSTVILEQIGSEAWVTVMNRVLQIMGAAIYGFGGAVDQFRGDGLVAFFGARSAHEDDPERALLAALVLQNNLKTYAIELAERYGIELLVRVGINTGEVITASIGNQAQHSEDTTMGEAVTLAARLESAAEPGTVLVSNSTYRLVAERFNWETLGEITIRGLSYAVAVYRPLNPFFEIEQQYRLQAHGLSTLMVGRDVDLKAIEGSITGLRAGKGGVMLISGEAGMGKSRLIFEARQRVERAEALLREENQHVTWLQGRCRSYGQTLPNSMWVDMWQRWLGLGHWVSQEEALDRLRRKALEFWGDQYTEYYPYLGAFLNLPIEQIYADQVRQVDAEGLRRQFFWAVRSWLEIMAQREPLVLVFTEAHWADEASLALLKYCLPLCLTEKILFVVVYRPERTTPVWNFKHYVETEYNHRLISLELCSLTETESSNLIEQMIGAQALSEQARAQILEKSNGNPYYLTELIHSLVDQGLLVRDAVSGVWHTLEDEVPFTLPDSLKGLLLARIDSLSPGERRVLQLAAVIGPIFWFNILELLSGNGGNLRAQLTAMQRAQFITERGQLPDLGREYAFNSTLIREAAYEGILSSQRVELHMAVAEFLEQMVRDDVLKQYHGLIAYHFHQAGDCQRELFHTMLAAQEAQRIHANVEAIQAYEQALALLEQAGEGECMPQGKLLEEWKLDALRGLGQIQFGVGAVQQAEQHFRQAIAIGRDMKLPVEALTRLFYWLGDVLFWQNSFEEPIRLGEEGLSLLGDQNESSEAALMNQLVAIGCSQLGDHDKFIDFTLRTAGFIQRLPYSEELRPAFDHIIALYAYTLKNLPEARRWLEIFRQKAEEFHDLRALGEYYEYMGVFTFQEGNPKAAVAMHRTAIEKFTQIGDAKHASRAWKSLGISYLQQGQIEEADACFDQALETAAVFANEADYAVGYWYKGQTLLCRGKWDEALTSFNKAGGIVREIPYLNAEWALSGVGRVYLAQDQKETALDAFSKALQDSPTNLFQNPYQAVEVLSGLDQSFDEGDQFISFVEKYRQEHPEVQRSPFKQWYLTPAELSPLSKEPVHHEVLGDSLSSDWVWNDPAGDCSYRLKNGLILQAANERNLRHINRSTPRLLRASALQGDFTLQVICQSVSKNQPAIGGLLVWLSDKYWFCLEVGGRGAHEILLRGFMNNTDYVFGRGKLRVRKFHLRLERCGNWLSAFCSGGKRWQSVGGCELSTIEPLHLGLHAVGHINRMVYPGAYPQGTAIQFNEFWLWDC